MLPPCLSLEESFRKGGGKRKKQVFYAELGLSCGVCVETQSSLSLGGECSALCWGVWAHGEPQGREEGAAWWDGGMSREGN